MVKLSEVPLGALVVCEIFHLFEHTGIYIGEGQIVELQGTGLVRSVSVARFMDNRSGEELMLACDSRGKPIGNMAAAERAASQIFTYQTYDLISNNCHRFCCNCLSGRHWPVTSFFDLRQVLEQQLGQKILFKTIQTESHRFR
ncbi:lecithin retinol acyltransferase family protein [Rheinheimera texasensis]|uniref:lecithin retinol acyltransferase family protein n=1 Tax=Rheinheimera texasensis TaxID=306205 RepID=UPI0032B2852D